jgi:hypothetical protein
MGCDPTIGDPAWVATQAGSFLSERSNDMPASSYKDGLSEQRNPSIPVHIEAPY